MTATFGKNQKNRITKANVPAANTNKTDGEFGYRILRSMNTSSNTHVWIACKDKVSRKRSYNHEHQMQIRMCECNTVIPVTRYIYPIFLLASTSISPAIIRINLAHRYNLSVHDFPGVQQDSYVVGISRDRLRLWTEGPSTNCQLDRFSLNFHHLFHQTAPSHVPFS